jgi:ketosteroid isomerase-like protein/tetratricopeptide (TPR) repeat protein
MDCASCRRANREGARFCSGCGSALVPRCSACGAELAADARFCDSCGAAVAAPAAQDSAVARKVVTIVFADLVGSTSLQERLDAESTRRVMERYYAAMRGPVEAHGGTVVQLLGDGVMCAFGVPHVAEDDALRAVRAAVAMQRAFREFKAEQGAVVANLGLRIAVNTGEVVVSDERPQGIGDPLNVAGRLQQEAREGDVLIGEATRRLVSEQVTLAHFGTFALKGRAEPVPAYRVVSLERPAGAAAIAFVGREDELRRLTSLFEAAVTGSSARLAAILGSPGLGKSRLLAELARRLEGRATVLTARCDAAGGATFAPLADALRAFLELDTGADIDAVRAAVEEVLPADDAERGRIAKGVAALVAGTPASPEETFFVVRRLLAALAATQPVVLALDDLQWAEPLLLDLTEHLVQWSSGVPLLVLVAARPELRDSRSSLAAPGGLVTEVVTLGGLDAGAATRLAANVIGADELPAAIAGRVLAASEGNPLFVGELVRMLVHDGALKREGDRWTTSVALADLEMPPTIQALLAARIERLRPEERTILERAAVVGRHFSRAAVAQLLPREIGDLDARLESLRRSELIEPDTGWFLGEPALRFHHALIRDAAYRRVLRGTRAGLHERFADWVVSRVGEAVEHDETIGWHLEQAHQQLRELGPLDARGQELGQRAAKHLAAAGRRALARDDLPVAANLLGRALDRLDVSDPTRAELALDRCESLLAAGNVGPAAAAIAELARFASDSDRMRAWHTCFAGQLAALTDPQSLRATAEAVAAAAQSLGAAGDTAGEAKAHSVHALALQRLGKVGACEAALDLALAAARRVHDRRRSNAVLAGVPLAALWGPSPVTRASGRCLDVVRVLRITQGAPAVEAVALRCQAVLEALRGRADAARRMLASSRRMVEELGLTPQLLETDVFSGIIDLLEGDAVAAERSLRGAYDGLREHGLGIDAARAAALLARALFAQGRAAEAEALSRESESLAGDDLHAAIAWRGARAEALARRGEHAQAVEFARAAVELAAATDALLDHADARSALATALRAAGRNAEADTEERRAIELWEAKGATLPAERARRAVRPSVAVTAVRSEPPMPTAPVRPKVRANAATAFVTRLDAVVAARDAAALSRLFADFVEIVHHPTATKFGRDGGLARFGSLMRSDEATCRHEPLAALGDSLALCHLRTSVRSLGDDDVAPFGAIDADEIILLEVDARGQGIQAEIFGSDHLADATVRLYERYAESLPAGRERTRAAATARSVAAVLGVVGDHSAFRAVLAPDLEFVDHRQLGFGRAHSADAVRRGNLVLHEVAEQIVTPVTELLALRSDGLLAYRTFRGIDRASGGPFERELLELWTFGSDGLLVHLEHFDRGAASAAVARFDALAAESPAKAVRRVRPNAATEASERLVASVAARDPSALAPLFANVAEFVEHATGAAYDGRALLETWNILLRAENPTLRSEPLATLGDSLALFSGTMSFGALAEADVGPFGAVTRDEIVLTEVGAEGGHRRVETFALDHLADAIARLYERYADSLADGPERARAAATARVVAVLMAPPALEAYRTVFADDVAWADHRTLGFGSLQGREALLRAFRSLFESSADLAVRVEDVVALEPNALLVRWTISGTDRAEGGAFERQFLLAWAFGGDGLVIRSEQFDAGREAEALGRIDAIPAPPTTVRVTRRVRPNAATANAARMDAAVAARDLDAFLNLIRDDAQGVHHPTGVRYEESRSRDNYRAVLGSEGAALRHVPLASLGDSHALFSTSLSVLEGIEDSIVPSHGAFDSDMLLVTEVDRVGLRRFSEFFAADRLAAAIARLYELYAESLSEGPTRTRAASIASSIARLLAPPDLARWGSAFSPAIEWLDHRTVGLGPVHGAEAVVRAIGALFQLLEFTATQVDEILDLRADSLVLRWTNLGTDRAGGGSVERNVCLLWTFAADGLLARWEQFEPGAAEQALARIDELGAGSRKVARRVRPNAATAHAARLEAAAAARDFAAFKSQFADGAQVVHHPTGTTFDESRNFPDLEWLLQTPTFEFEHRPLATLGDSLALCRASMSFSSLQNTDFDLGASANDWFLLIEVDRSGRRSHSELFANDRLGNAIARLYERHAESLPEEAARARAAATARSVATMHSLDVERFATALAPDVEFADHAPLGIGPARGARAILRGLAALHALAADAAVRDDDVLELRHDLLLACCTTTGTDRASGGAFERRFLALWVFGSDGLATRVEWFASDREAEALARVDELTAGPKTRRVRPNAATANAARLDAAAAARDFAVFKDQFAEGGLMVHHPTGTTFEASRNLPDLERLLQAPVFGFANRPIATLGDSLVLLHASLSFSGVVEGTGFDFGAVANEWWLLTEVDGAGRRRHSEFFATDRLDDAVVRLYELYAESLSDEAARARAAATARAVATVLGSVDVARYAAVLAPDIAFADHRPLGLPGSRGAEAFLHGLRVLHEVAVDAAVRDDEILDLRPDSLLVRRVSSGTDRASGGAYERHFFVLATFGSGGLVTRIEWFAPDCERDALARFDELTAESRPAAPRRVRPNAATANAARADAAIAARDVSALPDIFADHAEVVHHPTGAVFDQRGVLSNWRTLLGGSDVRFATVPIATLGDSLALCRGSFSFGSLVADADSSFGAVAKDEFILIEVDARGRRMRLEFFAMNRLGDAIARLYERHAESLSKAAPRARASATARSVGHWLKSFEDVEHYPAWMSPEIRFVDHRPAGMGSSRGIDFAMRATRAQLELARDNTFRIEDVRALGPSAFLLRSTSAGIDRASGGSFERPLLMIGVFGPDGLLTRLEWFEPGRDVEALARFDSLTAESQAPAPHRVRLNAATANAARADAAILARDEDAIETVFADHAVIVHHPTGVVYDEQGSLANWRSLFQATDLRFATEACATLGESLALCRTRLSFSELLAADSDPIGAVAKDDFIVIEVDARGRRTRAEFFATDRLGDAIVRLYERHAESLPEGPARERGAAIARSAAVLTHPFDIEHYPTALAPDVAFVDHRPLGLGSLLGIDGVTRWLGSLAETTEDLAVSYDDVLGLRADMLLVKTRATGTLRAGGGAFEHPLVHLFVAGADGKAKRLEWFDFDQLDAALARFDSLTAESRSAPRRVRPNAATANAERMDAAVAARDLEAFYAQLADGAQSVHHPTGVVYTERDSRRAYELMLHTSDLVFAHEPLATLGESLALCFGKTSFTGVTDDELGDYGATNLGSLIVMETDARGLRKHTEFFATDDLADAVTRLYERYAELQPEGAARDAAATVARSMRAMIEAPDLEDLRESFAPDIELVDRRSLGTWSARGREAALDQFRSLLQVAGGIAMREYEILRVEARASLVRRTHVGTDRASGGSYERRFIMLLVCGADGLLTRMEWFDADREAEALAHFDSLADESLRPARRVRPNAATANAARLEAAIAARDANAFPALFAESAESVHHPTGAVYDRNGVLASLQLLLESEDLAFEYEALATLGESLALCRAHLSHGPIVSDSFAPFGAAETDLVVLFEVDARGRRTRAEFFAPKALAAAIVRLYELYAESLPAGPARERARVTADSAAALSFPFDSERYSRALAPDAAFVDHRPLGLGTEGLSRWLGTLPETADDLALTVDDVLALRPDSLLVDTSSRGTLRASGGAFEQANVQLFVVGADGRVTRVEWFDPGQIDEALARFDSLTAESPKPQRRVRPNAATANAARLDAAVAARDIDAFLPFIRDDLVSVHHPTGATYDREGAIVRLRAALRAERLTFVHKPLATLGESLALCSVSTSTSRQTGRTFDVGPTQHESFELIEVDGQSRRGRLETFADHRLGDAIARLYERYAESLPDTAARTRAAVTARSIANLVGTFDLERLPEALEPEVELDDHRPAGFGSLHGAQEVVRAIATAFEVADDLAERCQDVLAARPDALLLHWVTSGRMRVGGGEFEWPHLRLCIVGPNGLFSRVETFAPDKVSESLARFDELAGSPTARFSNASWRARQRFERCWRERDWDGAMASFDPAFVFDDRRALVRLQIEREHFVANQRFVFAMKDSQYRSELLATRGERLSLARTRLTGEARGGGPVEFEHLSLVEVGADGRYVALVVFDADDGDAAYAELDQRYVAGEGAPWAELIDHQRALTRAAGSADRAALARLLPADFTVVNYQRFGGTGDRRNKDEYVENIRALDDLGVRGELRLDHLPHISATAAVAATTWYGTRKGGEFETSQCVVCTHDGQRFHSWEIFDPDQLDAALARYEELTVDSTPERFANAASRTIQKFARAWRERDWDGVVALTAPTHQMDDRRPLMRMQISGPEFFANERMLFQETASQWRGELLATRGERLALLRMRFTAEADGSGPMAVEMFDVIEVDDAGRRAALVVFDLDSLDAAYAELDRRYVAGEGAGWADLLVHMREAARALGGGDPATLSRVLPDDFISVNRQRFGGTEERARDQIIANSRNLADLNVRGDIRFDHLPRISATAALVASTWYGTRDGGEFESSYCSVLTHDGRQARSLEIFDRDQFDRALARYEELIAERVTRRIENAASRAIAHGNQCLEAQDWAGFAAQFGPDFRHSDRRRMIRLELDRAQYLEFVRPFIMRQRTTFDLVATRGSRLAMLRFRWVLSDDSVGPSDNDFLMVAEVDDAGTMVATVAFDCDSLDAAYVELDRRYAAGEAALHRDTWETLQRRHQAHAAHDWEQVVALSRADLVTEDHRPVRWGTLRTREEYVARIRGLVELAPDVTLRLEHVLALSERNLLTVLRWVGTREGGAFEVPVVNVSELDSDGVRVLHVFDLEQLDEARACYDALRRESRAPRIENGATLSLERLTRCWATRDWDGVSATLAPGFRQFDRRPMMQLDLDRDQFLAFMREVYDMSSSRLESEVLATRGDRWALARVRFEGASDSIGLTEIESLAVIEADERGSRSAMVRFAADDLDAAYAELDARYAATDPEYARLKRFTVCTDERDWDAVAASMAPDFVMHDHRPLGRETLHGGQAWIDTMRALVELAPDVRLRIDHFSHTGSVALIVSTWVGTRDGGAFEDQKLIVSELDEGGRFRRMDQYELAQLDLARARFDALCRESLAPRIENAATRTGARGQACWWARDWAGFAALFAPQFSHVDRRALVQLELGRQQYLDSIRPFFEMGASAVTMTGLATRGDSLELVTATVRVGRPDAADLVGPTEFEFIAVAEVNARGENVAMVQFDPSDLDAAYAELDRRYAAGAGARFSIPFVPAIVARDLEAVAEALVPDLVVNDHRRVGWELMDGRAAYLESLESLFALAPDARLRVDHLSQSEAGALLVSAWVGTREGGAFEAPRIVVFEVDGLRRTRRMDFYDPEQLDRARAHFESLSAPSRDSLAALSNPTPATAAMDRMHTAFAARDWDAVRRACAPSATLEDRRRHVLVSLDLEPWMADMQEVVRISPDARIERRLTCTAGDRIAIERCIARGKSVEGGRGSFEIETFWLFEVDADGLITCVALFDPSDRRVAEREACTRWLARDPNAALVMRPIFELVEAHSDHDRARLRAVLADDVETNDHRRTGLGRVSGAAPFLDSLETEWALTPGVQQTAMFHVAREPHGTVGLSRIAGTAPEGGPFEYLLATVAIVERGLITRLEFFEPEDLDKALARLAELRPDPLRIPPNAATEASDSLDRAFSAQDWDAFAALCSPTMLWDDRRRRSLLTGGRDMFIANARVMLAHAGRLERTLLATAGDRLSLHRARWTGATADIGGFENENLSLLELDTEGRIAAIVAFELDDRRAASAELQERFARSGFMPWHWSTEIRRAIREHDLERARALLPDEFLFDDHRRVVAARLEGADAYVTWLGALFAQSPDALIEPFYYVAADEHRSLCVGHTIGTLADGGEFELVWVQLTTPGGAELFDLDDLERARARFEELRADPLRIPPNAALRVSDRLHRTRDAQDWDAFAALCAPGLEFDDRRRSILATGDRDAFIANSEWIAAQGIRVTRTPLATAGDRLALEHHHYWIGAMDAPESELESLAVTEIDAEGRAAAVVIFDSDDRRAASIEMRSRFVRDRGAAPWMEAFARAARDHDLAGCRAALPQDFVFHDRRRVGAGRLEREDYVAWLESLFEQSPDALLEPIYYLAVEKYGSLAIARNFGTLRSGGRFENVYVQIATPSAAELFELDDLELARARFAELRPDPLRIPPNAASLTGDRLQQAIDARDWDGLREMCAPAMQYEDRRRGSLLAGDREMFVASAAVYVSNQERMRRTLLATAGDRLSLTRLRRSGATPDVAAWEMETLSLIELDAEGRIARVLAFDPDERRAASLEMFERYARSEAARSIPAATLEGIRAMNAHDLERLRAVLPRDFVLDDHRRTGLGRIEGGAFIESLAAVFAESRGWTVETLHVLAAEPHGELAMARAFGTLASGGEFEAVYLRILAHPSRMELFEPEDLELARARFAELRPSTTEEMER